MNNIPRYIVRYRYISDSVGISWVFGQTKFEHLYFIIAHKGFVVLNSTTETIQETLILHAMYSEATFLERGIKCARNSSIFV